MDASPDIDQPGSWTCCGTMTRLDLDRDSVDRDDPIQSLDVKLLHDRILEPLLGIKDERTIQTSNSSGIRQRACSRVMPWETPSPSLKATTIEQLLDVADAGACRRSQHGSNRSSGATVRTLTRFDSVGNPPADEAPEGIHNEHLHEPVTIQ